MSKNNSIRKSDKKYIRKEKARIRRDFLDVKKQEELISQLYSKFLPKPNLNKEPSVSDDKSVKSQIPISKPQIPTSRGSSVATGTNPKSKITSKNPKSKKQ